MIPPPRALLLIPSRCNSNGTYRGPSQLNATVMKITHGPPDLPAQSVSRALRCAAFAFSSTKTNQLTFPSCSGPGALPIHANESPSSESSPNFPWSTCQRYAPSQNPCVGRASKLHGHPQSQLQAPSKVPRIVHFVAMAVFVAFVAFAACADFAVFVAMVSRSEERRVGKECRSRGSEVHGEYKDSM